MGHQDFSFHDEFGPAYVVRVYNHKIGLRGILVIDNLAFGPGKGGIRMTPSVTEEEVFRLARTMTWKNALAGIPFGGAKSGIIYDSRSKVDKKSLIQGFARAIKNFLPDKYIAGPDVNTGEREMQWFVEAVRDRKAATGKPKKLGGLPHELGSTGFGVAQAVKIAADFKKIDLKKATVAIEGFGNVGSFAFKFLSDMGAKIVAVADSRSTIYSREPIDYERLLKVKASGRTVGDYTDGKKLLREAIFALPVDILVLATVTDVINEKNKNSVQAKIIVEGSNIPIKETIEKELGGRGILIVPDFVANAGGVISSYAEYKGYGAEKMFKLVKEKVTESTELVLSQSFKKKISPREAALKVAKEKVLKGNAALINGAARQAKFGRRNLEAMGD